LGAKQQEAFEKIKKYLPPVLKAPKRGIPFRLYVAAEDKIIGAVLTQETKGKEYIITYMGQRLIDAETRYAFIEKLCLSLYYACTKLRHYPLSGTCIITCQADVIKHMLQKPILCARIGKWAYALVEYDWVYESLRAVKGQIVVDFIVGHRINDERDLEVGYITCTPWKLFFDGSACDDDGQGIGAVSLRVALFLNSQIDWKKGARITKLNMKHFYLAWNSWNLWVLNMWKLMEIHFWWCSKYPRYANGTMNL
jgi:hypothetical protein